jgi:hypothetical protein
MAYTLRERIGGYERESVTGLAADRLANPADLLLAGAVRIDKATAAIAGCWRNARVGQAGARA